MFTASTLAALITSLFTGNFGCFLVGFICNLLGIPYTVNS